MSPVYTKFFGATVERSLVSTKHVRFMSIPSHLGFIQLRSIADRINKAVEQYARNFYHLGLLWRRRKMDVLPQLPPYQGNRIRKGRVSFVIPRRAAHASEDVSNLWIPSQRERPNS